MDPNADTHSSGCVLMMQYMGQTLPLEPFFDEDTRPVSMEVTTSCHGVVNSLCREDIVDIIKDFDYTRNGGIQCDRLTEYFNTELRGCSGACGGDGGWIANFFNVTGGNLPQAELTVADAERLGSDECRPSLPAIYEMYKAAEVRQLFFHDPPEAAAGFLGHLFGGRTGRTPDITVVYGNGEEEGSPEITFLCMETFGRDGEKRESPLQKSGSDTIAVSLVLAAGPLVAAGFYELTST